MIRDLTVTCPNCQSELNVKFYDVLELSEKVIESLEEDRLFKIVCSKCQKEIRVNYDCLLVDKDKEYALALCFNATSKDIKNLVSTFNYLDDKCQKRIVASRQRLLEKIYIFQDNLNDYAIEIMKALNVLSLVKEFGSDKKIEIYYSSDNNGQFVAYVNNDCYGLPFEKDIYEQIEAGFKEENEDEFKVIDYNWALKILAESYGE